MLGPLGHMARLKCNQLTSAMFGSETLREMGNPIYSQILFFVVGHSYVLGFFFFLHTDYHPVPRVVFILTERGRYSPA